MLGLYQIVAIKQTIDNLHHQIQQPLVWNCDNKAVVDIINSRRTRSNKIYPWLCKILNAMNNNNWQFRWLRGVENPTDSVSRNVSILASGVDGRVKKDYRIKNQ